MIESRVVVHCLSLLILVVQVSRPVCVEAPSETEAVRGSHMKLTCISCMKREEVKAETRVDWYYVLSNNEPIQIFQYDRQPQELDGPWKGRLLWNGSKDLQDVSISIINVTHNDSGIYRCDVFRQFNYDFYTPSFSVRKEIRLVVHEGGVEDATAFYSEIMMYVLLVFLTFWLLVEMIYCYRKISKSDEQVQDNATDYLAIPSENKENPGAPVME
ncbi:sodium channel regulatory subunit beta-3 isoform X2 [Scleropages formosus]|uniref:Sodium channel regulatory subunit beta-3 n=2 Tax=Scleropages formosus TaxID=113540 RepID=A0A8C9QZ43_SCLFO|nr:sodium channel subunit beta-3 isoform X2 [Scleropages formosus]